MQASHNPDLMTSLDIAGRRYACVDLPDIVGEAVLARLPYSVRLLIENVARCAPESLDSVLARALRRGPVCAVPFHPNRLMMHDTTCLPALADLAGMRDAVHKLGGRASAVNPSIPVVLTIDHSVIVDDYGHPDSVARNLDAEFRRNAERYRFIKWAEQSLDRFRVIPPGTGIIHQMNMEVVAQVVCDTTLPSGDRLLHPDDMVATDSHTPMINALGVLAWGVGGLDGLAALLGEPVTIPFPEVVGIRLVNALPEGVTATDLALTVAEMLRARSVVGKFVEFCGPGLATLRWGGRGTVANMAPEYGATVVFFPFDDETSRYLRLSGRADTHIELVERYVDALRLRRHGDAPEPEFDELVELDLARVRRSVAGPAQPHQRQDPADAARSFRRVAPASSGRDIASADTAPSDKTREPSDGAVVIAAITSCTNTANPDVMIQAGLLARNARARGLMPKPWVKTSLSPGSRVVADYLRAAGLLEDLAALGFELTGFGCMTCIGNSGRLESHAEQLVDQGLTGVAVLSGNRNFTGRVNPKVPAGYLASPALVVAYALAGRIDVDIETDPVARDASGHDVYLRDLMPADEQVLTIVDRYVRREDFQARARNAWTGTPQWAGLSAEHSVLFGWDPKSTYLRRPGYLERIDRTPGGSVSVRGARVFMLLGDNVTTDHISPAGPIPPESLAGRWLLAHGEAPQGLNQYSTRRSNHEVMLRGAYANRFVKNRLLGVPASDDGGQAWNADRTRVGPVYETAQSYVEQGVPLVILAGANYGAGSSRDWAAKTQAMLGVKVVVARSFERIHRSNLIGMGVYPLTFPADFDPASLELHGDEELDFDGLAVVSPGVHAVDLCLRDPRGAARRMTLTMRIDSTQEAQYLRHGGVLPFCIRKIVEGG